MFMGLFALSVRDSICLHLSMRFNYKALKPHNTWLHGNRQPSKQGPRPLWQGPFWQAFCGSCGHKGDWRPLVPEWSQVSRVPKWVESIVATCGLRCCSWIRKVKHCDPTIFLCCTRWILDTLKSLRRKCDTNQAATSEIEATVISWGEIIAFKVQLFLTAKGLQGIFSCLQAPGQEVFLKNQAKLLQCPFQLVFFFCFSWNW